MAWGLGWFSSPAAPPKPSDKGNELVSPPPQQSQQESWRREDIQRFQMELMALETKHRDALLKARQQEEAASARALPQPPPLAQTNPTTALQRSPQENFVRTAKQLGLFVTGAGFLAASVMISRRAVSRKMVDAYPKLFQQSHHGPKPPPRAPADKGNDQVEAVEALGLATLNVFSFGIMMTGGLMYGFDISNVDELRQKARKSIYGQNGVVDEQAEEQVAEWIAEVLDRRDKRDGKQDLQRKDE